MWDVLYKVSNEETDVTFVFDFTSILGIGRYLFCAAQNLLLQENSERPEEKK